MYRALLKCVVLRATIFDIVSLHTYITKVLRVIHFAGLAQAMFQMPGMQHDPEHEELQRVQQTTILRGVSLIRNLLFQPSLLTLLILLVWFV